MKELVALMHRTSLAKSKLRDYASCMSLSRKSNGGPGGPVANVVYGGAVPILCQKLLDIQFIDLAEQALSTLAKISVDFPASLCGEGGLTIFCISGFFPPPALVSKVSTAATVVVTSPHDSFPVVRDVMPTLLNVLSSSPGSWSKGAHMRIADSRELQAPT